MNFPSVVKTSDVFKWPENMSELKIPALSKLFLRLKCKTLDSKSQIRDGISDHPPTLSIKMTKIT